MRRVLLLPICLLLACPAGEPDAVEPVTPEPALQTPCSDLDALAERQQLLAGWFDSLVEGVDFPTLALSQADWSEGSLRLRLHPQNEEVKGAPTQFKVVGLRDPTRWRIEGDAQAEARGADLVIDTTVGDHLLGLLPA